MKKAQHFSFIPHLPLFACLSSFIFHLSSFSFAGLPQPSVIYFGQAMDNLGWPYRKNAQVILRINGREYSRYDINGSVSPGVNFMLNVLVDDGSEPDAYAPKAARVGDPVAIAVVAGGQETPVLTGTIPPIGPPGAIQAIRVTSGVDSNGSGLPDSWEQDLVNNSGGVFTNINQVRKEDDFDGDGISNGDEYYAGTIPYWECDYFFIERLGLPTAPFRMDFLSVPGKKYALQESAQLTTGPWISPSHLLESATVEQMGPFSGDGYFMSIRVAPTNRLRYYRLTVE